MKLYFEIIRYYFKHKKYINMIYVMFLFASYKYDKDNRIKERLNILNPLVIILIIFVNGYVAVSETIKALVDADYVIPNRKGYDTIIYLETDQEEINRKVK